VGTFFQTQCRMWANAQHDGRPAEYRWRPLLNATVWLTPTTPPTTRVPCSNAANIGERKTWTQSEFCTWQNSVMGQEPQKNVYIVYQPRRWSNIVQFGWLLLSDIAAVTKPRRETHWNLLGCPKLTKRSQPLVGRSSPHCVVTWGIYYCLTSFFPIVDMCLSGKDIALQSCAMVHRWRIFGDFLRPVFFQQAACSTF